ncbi:hypothetical protein D7Z26_24135 [Cohnella endophytica]|uniref:Uncharacterized protein n=1 Tax=Cohnella endophytica TaxID=2419778 RepID=A0A494XAN2_9BACL|nr:hypothetical protein [Cohnella endophytica]RKP46701.1 hypothetical protein D7Z26_24135 [Cohnella endophytica]
MRESAVRQTQDSYPDAYRETPPRSKKRGAFLFFLILWIILIACGAMGAKWYSDRIQQQVTIDLAQQTAAQITALQQDYDSRIAKLETGYQEQIAEMNSKIESLNELLNFAKDNADTKTDNSNKLYTQLAEVKKQLAELKKSLDVLK